MSLAALVILPPLGYPAMLTSHEAQFALLGRDVLDRGVWFPNLQGRVYRNKPPLFPLAIAAVSRVEGRVTPTTALVPVAAGALAAVVGTFLLGDRLFGRRVGMWAGVMLATTYGFFTHSRMILPDMVMVGFMALATWAAWEALSRPTSHVAFVGFYAALALGLFAKGPAGLIPLLVAAAWLWSERGPRALVSLWSPAGAAAFALVTSVWLVPFFAVRGPAHPVPWSGLFAYLGAPQPVSLAGQVVRGLMGLAPWTLMALLAVPAAVRGRKDAKVRFALLAFGVPLVVTFLSHTQRTRYLLPIYPGAILLAAWWADADGRRTSPTRRVLAGVALLAGLGLLTASLWVRPSPRLFLPHYSPEMLPLLAGITLLTVALFGGLWTGRPALTVHGGAAAMLLILTYGSWLQAGWTERTRDVPRLARLVAQHGEGTTPGVFATNVFHLELDFYLGQETIWIGTASHMAEHLGRPERPVVVVEQRVWERERDTMPSGVVVLERLRLAGREVYLVRAM